MPQNVSFTNAGATTAGTSLQQRSESQIAHAGFNGRQGSQLPLSTHGAIASMAQIPGVDMSALAGVSSEQITLIAQLLQSGALSLPLQTPSMQPNVQPGTGNEQASLHNQHANTEKEDGELDDGEEMNTPKGQGFLRPPPTGPRKRSRSPYSSHNQPRSQRDPQQSTNVAAHSGRLTGANASNAPHAPLQDEIPTGPRADLVPTVTSILGAQASRQAASVAFVTELLKAGYPYEDLAKEVTDPARLRVLFEKNGLPVPHSAPPILDEINLSGAFSGAERKAAVIKRPTAKVAAPKDRSEYLAKLQAAKKKKLETPVSPAIPRAAPVGTTLPFSTVRSPVPAKETQIGGKSKPVRKVNNELIRQRLEALKAEQAAKGAAKGNSHAPNAQVIAAAAQLDAIKSLRASSNDDDKNLVAQDTVPVHVPSSTAPSDQPQWHPSTGVNLDPLIDALPSHNTGMLPGLFMPSGQAKVAQRKRGVASDFYDDVTPNPSFGVSKRPFGWSQHQQPDESLIITVSDDDDEDDNEDGDDDDDDDDDDDEGDEMDIDSSSDEGSLPKERKPIVQGATSGDVSLPYSLPQSTVSSTPGTPSSQQTASLSERAAILERTEQGILIMRKRLAEAEKRKAAGKLNPKSTVGIQQAQLSAAQSSGNGLTDSTKLSESKAEKERWRRRLQELEQAQRAINLDSAKSPVIQSNSVSHLPSVRDTSDKDTFVTDGSTHNEDGTLAKSRSLSFDPSGNDESMQDGGDDVELLQTRNDNNATTQTAQIRSASGDSSLPFQELQQYPAVDKRAPDDPNTVINSEDDEDMDDDLDDVYGEPNAAPPANRSLTSAHITMQEIVKGTDIDMKSTDDSSIEDDDDDDDLYEPVPGNVPSQANSGLQDNEQAPEEDKDRTDSDLASELQPSAEQASKSPAKGPKAPAEQRPNLEAHFVVYESPLTKFKDYRYHPEFLESVSGGFKSLTYSHQIDPDKPLCPYEANGGKCNDKTCEFQHFGDMVVSDNDLLKAMGTANVPAKTGEEDKKWKAGLAAVVKQLRSTNVGKDVQAIAQRIAEYRREFVNDPTRTLYLD